MSTLVFDIGGTNLRMAVGTDNAVHDVQKIPTPEHPEEAIAALATYAKEKISDATGASGGIAGFIQGGIVHSSAHLPEWKEFHFAEKLSEALHLPVHITNDAEAAAVGEAVYGAGKGYGLVAYIGIGTGIGGSLIVNGVPAPHAQGFEPGHQVLEVSSGETFEELVSGSGLLKRFGTPAKELPRTVYDELTPTLAAGLYNVLLEWSPEVLVLGGSLMNEENGYRVSDVERALSEMPQVFSTAPTLRHAQLGDENGLYGALAKKV